MGRRKGLLGNLKLPGCLLVWGLERTGTGRESLSSFNGVCCCGRKPVSWKSLGVWMVGGRLGGENSLGASIGSYRII